MGKFNHFFISKVASLVAMVALIGVSPNSAFIVYEPEAPKSLHKIKG